MHAKISIKQICVNIAYRQILDLHDVVVPVAVCMHYANYDISNLETVTRRQTFGFNGRLCKICNTIIETFENAWIAKIQLWDIDFKCGIQLDNALL